jgi:hypothetical protein
MNFEDVRYLPAEPLTSSVDPASLFGHTWGDVQPAVATVAAISFAPAGEVVHSEPRPHRLFLFGRRSRITA